MWEAPVPEARDWEAEAMQDWEEALVDTTALQAVVVEEGLGLVGEAAVVLAEEDLGLAAGAGLGLAAEAGLGLAAEAAGDQAGAGLGSAAEEAAAALVDTTALQAVMAEEGLGSAAEEAVVPVEVGLGPAEAGLASVAEAGLGLAAEAAEAGLGLGAEATGEVERELELAAMGRAAVASSGRRSRRAQLWRPARRWLRKNFAHLLESSGTPLPMRRRGQTPV